MSSSRRRPTYYNDSPIYDNYPPSASYGRPHYNDGYFSDSNFSGSPYGGSHYSDSHYSDSHYSDSHYSGLHSSGLHSSQRRGPPPPPTGYARERRSSFASARESAAPHSSRHRRHPSPPTGHARERRSSFASAGESAAPPFAPTTRGSSYYPPPPSTRHAPRSARRSSFASTGGRSAPPSPPRTTSRPSERSEIDTHTDRIVEEFSLMLDNNLEKLYEREKAPYLTVPREDVLDSVKQKVKETLRKEVEYREYSGRSGGDMGSVTVRPENLKLRNGGDEMVLEKIETYWQWEAARAT
ncbi:hypothetical protein B9479_003645 [Cryptococcus floricola]|uniref:Uncharacterized protein n=1 Tax=Cryptococcus floricola TaxID=2591691 RepID=A0A5D3AZU7_9TREE|nr:hypothetical protein B9479_003645 [Cryptococcus floricola]